MTTITATYSPEDNKLRIYASQRLDRETYERVKAAGFATPRGMGLNEIAGLDFTDDDRQQFAQLIGYSLSGYSELQSYVTDEAYATAAQMAHAVDERDARIAALEQKLAELRAAADMLREPVARLLEMHPDDLKP